MTFNIQNYKSHPKTKFLLVSEKMKKIIFITLILLFFCTGTSYSQQTRRVFIVCSYNKNNPVSLAQEKGVYKGLSHEGWIKGINLDIRTFYMDTKRRYTTPEAIRHRGELTLKYIYSWKPDVVIVIDENAFNQVGLKLVGQKNIAVVFTGINCPPEIYNQQVHFMDSRLRPGLNITGVYEKIYIDRSIKVMQAALGFNKGNIVALLDDSPTGYAFAEQFAMEKKNFPPGINWIEHRVNNWQEYKAFIKKINQDKNVKALFIAATRLLDLTTRNILTLPEIIKWTIQHNHIPEIAGTYFLAEMGLFGGASVDFKSMGALAGKKAGMILSGTNPGEIPIEDAPDFAIVFNLKRAKELGIEIPAPLLGAADYVYR